MRATPLLAALLVAACSGSGGGEGTAILERAVRATGGTEAHAGIRSVGIHYRGRLLPPEGLGGEIPFTGEWYLRLPDGLASRSVTGDLLTRKAATASTGWFRRGAAVRELSPGARLEEQAERDDLLALLVSPLLSPPFSVEPASDLGPTAVRVFRKDGTPFALVLDPETGRPATLRRPSYGEDGRTDLLVRTFSDWRLFDGIQFPGRIETEVAGGKQILEVVSVALNPQAPEDVFDRPADGGPGRAGEIRREKYARVNVVVVAQRRPYTDLATADLYLARALERSKATRRGPILRIFRAFPDADGVAEVATMVQVDLSRDPGAIGLPAGMAVELLPEVDALVMPYTGPYPVDASVYAPLAAKAAELGLAPLGPPWHAILSDPDEGAPADLEQEIRLPVTEKK